jgi:6-phosphogluconolactonase
MLKNQLQSFDERRDLFLGEDQKSAIAFASEHWIHTAQRAIQQHGRFAVALSGGSTPAAIYQALAQETTLDWSKIFLFWSDERAVPPDHPESNYRMAMNHLKQLPIPTTQIFRMQAETDIERNALRYEEQMRHQLGKSPLDLVMLGVGEDGHTASLFPDTPALSIEDRLIAANYVPQLKTWRMTFTFPCINQASHIAIYALGPAKQNIVSQVLNAAIQSPFPASRVGTPQHKAL